MSIRSPKRLPLSRNNRSAKSEAQGISARMLAATSATQAPAAGWGVQLYSSNTSALGGVALVGIDGSDSDRAALEFAFDAAAARGTGVSVLHAYGLPLLDDMLHLGYDPAPLEVAAQLLLDEATEPFGERYPGVGITKLAVFDQPARSLLHAAAQA